MEAVRNKLIDWGVASLALPGQRESGDRHLVKVLPQEALVAAVDGLGHGDEAAAAAQLTIETLGACAGQSLIGLVRRCHEGLRGTRGVVMSLAAFHAADNTMTWMGIGNVEGYLLHGDARGYPGQEDLFLTGGIVGDRLPRLAASVIRVMQGDLLIFATDGVRPGFAKNTNLCEPPQQIADRILAQHGLGTDDALVLVLRYAYAQETNSIR